MTIFLLGWSNPLTCFASIVTFPISLGVMFIISCVCVIFILFQKCGNVKFVELQFLQDLNY